MLERFQHKLLWSTMKILEVIVYWDLVEVRLGPLVSGWLVITTTTVFMLRTAESCVDDEKERYVEEWGLEVDM
jgi:hypothetical protein